MIDQPSIRRAGAALLAAGALALSPTLAPAQEASIAPGGALAEMAMGDENAPVTVIEYASLTCNHCAHWHEEVFPTVKRDYIDTGKVRLILREYPTIPGHPALIARSYAGTMLARCAADEGGPKAYFDIMGALFADQTNWAFGDNPRGALVEIAENAGLGEAGFDACIQREALKDHIDRNIAVAADEYGVNSTPSFIVNGEVVKIRNAEEAAEVFDAALKDAGPR